MSLAVMHRMPLVNLQIQEFFHGTLLPHALSGSEALALWKRVYARLGLDLAERSILRQISMPILEKRLGNGRMKSFGLTQKAGTKFSTSEDDWKGVESTSLVASFEEGWTERCLPLLLEELLPNPGFVMGYMCDNSYFSAQHSTEVDHRQKMGFPVDEKRLIPYNLPPPLPTHHYDCRGLVGHSSQEGLYTAIPAGRMWLGEPFWEASGASKADVLAASWLRTSPVNERVIAVEAWPQNFTTDQGLQGKKQADLRRLLFPKITSDIPCETHSGLP